MKLDGLMEKGVLNPHALDYRGAKHRYRLGKSHGNLSSHQVRLNTIASGERTGRGFRQCQEKR